MPPSDEFDTIIAAVTEGFPAQEAGPRPQPSPEPHRVIWFLRGTALVQVNAILLYLLLWLLLHG